MEDSEYYYYHKVQGSDKLLLIFSALNIRPPKFSLFKKAQTLGVNVLYFNTPSVFVNTIFRFFVKTGIV